MTSTEGIENVLSLGDVRYIVVRPHRGMRDGFEVINAWKESQMREFPAGSRQEAIEYAQEKVARSRSFDYVLTVFPPKYPKESDDPEDGETTTE